MQQGITADQLRQLRQDAEVKMLNYGIEKNMTRRELAQQIAVYNQKTNLNIDASAVLSNYAEFEPGAGKTELEEAKEKLELLEIQKKIERLSNSGGDGPDEFVPTTFSEQLAQEKRDEEEEVREEEKQEVTRDLQGKLNVYDNLIAQFTEFDEVLNNGNIYDDKESAKRLRKGFNDAVGGGFFKELRRALPGGREANDFRLGSDAASFKAKQDSIDANFSIQNLDGLGVNPTDADLAVAKAAASSITLDINPEDYKEQIREQLPKLIQKRDELLESREGLTSTTRNLKVGDSVRASAISDNINQSQKIDDGDVIERADDAANAVSDFLGGQKIGEAIGELTFDRDPAKKVVAETIGMIENKFQSGEIDQQRRDNLIQMQTKTLEDAFGYDGPKATQLVGDIGKIALNYVGGAAIKGAATGINKLKSAAKTGAGLGAASGATESVSDGNSLGEVIADTAVGAGVGAGGGLVLQKGSNFLQSRVAKRNELQKLVEDGDLANSALAKYNSGDLSKDKIAIRAIKQGIDESDVVVVKSMSDQDRKVAKSMFELAKKAENNKTIIKRPTDLIGEEFVKHTKFIDSELKKRGALLDEVAEGLKDEPLPSLDNVLARVEDILQKSGTSIGSKGEIDFKGSDFEDMSSANKMMNNVYRRILESENAHDLHKVKRFIDSNVSYGVNKGDLNAQAQGVMKQWRKSIDDTLDANFESYNKVNTEYADLIRQQDQVRGLLGKDFDNTEFAEIKAGTISGRILSNAASRGQTLKVLTGVEKTSKKYGYDPKTNLVHQVLFADVLEDTFETQATRSFSGGIERGVQKGAETLLGRRGLTEIVLDSTGTAISAVRGITPENKKKVLGELLEK